MCVCIHIHVQFVDTSYIYIYYVYIYIFIDTCKLMKNYIFFFFYYAGCSRSGKVRKNGRIQNGRENQYLVRKMSEFLAAWLNKNTIQLYFEENLTLQ